MEKIAQFGRRMEIMPGVYPAFADCAPDTRPAPRLMALVNRRYGFGWPQKEGPAVEIHKDRIEEDLPEGRIPLRLGIDLVKPATEAVVTMTIAPAAASSE